MRHRHVVLALLCLLGVILYVDRVCISIALPRIQSELHVTPARLGWVSAAFSLGYAGFEIPSGHLGDRRGPRRVLMRIVVWWSAFTALTGAVAGLPSLLVTRFLFGVGEAGAFPNTSAVVSRWFPLQARARAIGAFSAATTLGGALSPVLVIPIQQRYGWRASFFLFAVLGLAWALVWYAWFRDAPSEKRGVRDAELAELGDAPPPAPHGLPWSVALRSRSVWALVATSFTSIYGSYFFVFWMPTYLAKGRGFTEAELRWASLAWIGSLVGTSGGGVLGDALVPRLGLARGRRLAGGTAKIVAALGFALAAMASGKAPTLVALTGSAIAFGVSHTTSFAACIDIGRSYAGTVSGVMNTAGQLAGAISGVVFGYLAQATGSYDAPIVVAAVVAGVGAAAWWMVDASTPLVRLERDEQRIVGGGMTSETGGRIPQR